MKLRCCDESRGGNNGGRQRSYGGRYKKTGLVKPEANYESAAMNFAQEKQVCNRHKDEDMNAQENANKNELVASDASVHVMNHVE